MRRHSRLIIAGVTALTIAAILLSLVIKRNRAMSKNPDFRNHLAGEQSPYLLQHADNPVDWYPWGNEAFERAKSQDKPIFLSIGYSTCHWCHVMEHESFEDDEVARLMNDAFVSIKVDREERPDIDNIYMTVCRMITGGGGWPLTIIMTPDKRPFFAATYIPRESRYGRSGMIELIPKVEEIWNSKRDDLEQSADEIIAALKSEQSNSVLDLNESVLRTAFRQFKQSFDNAHGGFGREPKFPSPHNLIYLLRYWNRTGDKEAMEMVEKTLTEMRRGGIYDHVGFGFHRYSTDSRWLLPHFEKMLYDQALLVLAYTELFQATGKDEFERTAREIITYVLRDMTDRNGGFYSAEDADSQGEEGKFYVWSETELKSILGEFDAEFIGRIYNFESDGNFVEQATGKKTGHNIPHLRDSLSRLARAHGMNEIEFSNRTRKALERLYDSRLNRVPPHKDDKILADWNGLMIAALAAAGRVFDEPLYIDAAVRSAEFVLNKMRDSNGRLLHRYRGGKAGIVGNIDDYAFMIFGLIELYQATFEIDYLEYALELDDRMIGHFHDRESGGFYFTADYAENLLIRQKEFYDGAVPSGNSVAAYNLIRLSRISGRTELEELAASVFKAAAGSMASSPTAFSFLLIAFDFAAGPSSEIVITGKRNSEDAGDMINALNHNYFPRKVVVLVDEQERGRIEKFAPYVAAFARSDGASQAYVCRDFACDAPVDDARKMLEKLLK